MNRQMTCLPGIVLPLLLFIAFPVLPTHSTDVQLFQQFNLTILRAETNKHRTGVKTSGVPKIPNLFVQVNVVAKRWDGTDIGRETFYARTKTIHSGKPIFNQTFAYTKSESPGFVLGTDTVMRVNLYDHDNDKDEWLGRFEIFLGHEVHNDRSKQELMSVVQRGEIGSAIWYQYDFLMFVSRGGLWGSDVASNWAGNSEEAEAETDYGK